MASIQLVNDAKTGSLSSSTNVESHHLPSAYFELPTAANNYHSNRPGRGITDYIRRMRHWAQMDWELTMWQMVYLCFQPNKVYNTTKYHKQTKNQWARDDPGFVVLLTLLLVMAAVSWGIAFRSMYRLPKLVLYVVVVDFVIVSIIVATFNWFITNRFMINGASGSGNGGDSTPRSSGPGFLVKQRVEWFYAFDVHCNSFFPAFLVLHVLQFLLVPIILHAPAFVSTFISNSIFLLAFGYYYFITGLGYSALPFVNNTRIYLFPIPVLVCAFVLSLIFQFNVSLWFISFYFPPH